MEWFCSSFCLLNHALATILVCACFFWTFFIKQKAKLYLNNMPNTMKVDVIIIKNIMQSIEYSNKHCNITKKYNTILDIVIGLV